MLVAYSMTTSDEHGRKSLRANLFDASYDSA